MQKHYWVRKALKTWHIHQNVLLRANSGIICYPFKDLDDKKVHAGLTWWRDYQKLKHNRLVNAELGNLENAAYAITAHYILLRILMDMLPESYGREYVKEKYCSDYLIICL